MNNDIIHKLEDIAIKIALDTLKGYVDRSSLV